MDLTASQKRSSVWEINYRDRVTLASILVQQILADEVAKQQLKSNISEIPKQLKCGFCNTPVHFSEPVHRQLYFKHRSAGKDEEVRGLHSTCPFHTGDDRHPLLAQIYSGEGRWHFETKHFVANILENDPQCKTDSVEVEKYIINHDENTKRRPDVYFEDIQNKKWAIELTNHWMNPTIAVERAKFFRNNNINVIWLLSPKCYLSQDAMFRFTLFGLSGKPNADDGMSSHFNGYAMDDDAILLSKREKKLSVKVLMPSFDLNKTENKIDFHIEEEVIHFSSLTQDNESNVPYLVHKGEDYRQAKEQLAAHQAYELEQKKQFERAEEKRKQREKNALIKANEEKRRQEREQRKRTKEERAKELANAKIGYEKFCNELVTHIKSLLENNFDDLPILNAIAKSEDMNLYLNDKIERIQNLNAKYGFHNAKVLQSLSSLRAHVDQLMSHYRAIMSSDQQAIINKQLSHINYLSQPFDYRYKYKPILSLALEMLDRVPSGLHEDFYQEYWNEISHQIREFSLSVSQEVESIVKESLKLAPIQNHIMKVIGAHNMLKKTNFAIRSQLHLNNIEQLKYLYERLSYSSFS